MTVDELEKELAGFVALEHIYREEVQKYVLMAREYSGEENEPWLFEIPSAYGTKRVTWDGSQLKVLSA